MDDQRLAELLVKAVDALPEAERAEALGGLVTRGLGGRVAVAAGPRSEAALRVPLTPQEIFGVTLPGLRPGPDAGVTRPRQPLPAARVAIPVRLTQEQHERLKAWCQANEFAMAAVIRGLVDRFLEQQADPD